LSNELAKPTVESNQPRILIVAGPNGAGKTTFAREFLVGEAHCPAFVNADLIAAGLSPFAPELAARKAARIMLEMISEHVRKRESLPLKPLYQAAPTLGTFPNGARLAIMSNCSFYACPAQNWHLSVWRNACGRAGTIFRRIRYAAGLLRASPTLISCIRRWWIAGCCWIIQPRQLPMSIGVNDEYKTD
jgi:hypothetical protein